MNTPMRILVAYDGSACSEFAIDDLGRGGLASNTSFLVVTVPDLWTLEIPEQEDSTPESAPIDSTVVAPGTLRSIATARETVLRGADRIRKLHSGWEVRWRIFPGGAAEGIVAAAAEWSPDLIVLGSHGRSNIGRLLLGSVSQKILHNAPCSVRIARESPTDEGVPLRLIVALDGSEESEEGVREVARRHWPVGTSVRVVAAIGQPIIPITPNAPFDVTQWSEEGESLERKRLEQITIDRAAMLRSAGLIAEGEVLDGHPVPVICDQARRWGADAIFLGARGHRLIERILLGSVSSGVAARAPCSVEVRRL